MIKIYEYYWEIMGLLVIIPLIALGLIASFSSHNVDNYYLSTSMDKRLGIGVDINWAIDSHIELDRNITYNEAIDLVKKLNDNLK